MFIIRYDRCVIRSINSSFTFVNQLNFPHYDFKIRKTEKDFEIFDDFRKKWVVVTPEEWVRQHVLKWLVEEKKYPSGLLAVEKQININGLSRRFDAVIFDIHAKPMVIIECKAPEVKITEEVFDQIARYNLVVNAEYLLITNGLRHYCCRIDHAQQSYSFLKELPDYNK
jgi:type I site-specific restriction-modification system R (restriction) subunit